ncbi:MAG: hypothetical protein GX896_02755 [Clostridiales bacterium]|nr:hypothetical protein [Clostridiales bacterium]
MKERETKFSASSNENRKNSMADDILEKIRTDIKKVDKDRDGKSKTEFEENESQETDLTYIAFEKRHENNEKATNEKFMQMSEGVQKSRYDILNLGIIAVFILLVGMTFLFMGEDKVKTNKVEFNAKNVSTGEYASYVLLNYYKDMPLSQTMYQANVLVSHFYGKSDLEFKEFKKPSSIKDANHTGMDDGDYDSSQGTVIITTTIVETTPQNTGTTEKKVQEFEGLGGGSDQTTSWNFSPPQNEMTTTKAEVTTTIKMPVGTDQGTTREVNLD